MTDTNTTETEARTIMGSNFFGPDDVATHLGITFSEEQKQTLSVVPFEQWVLEQFQDRFLLIAEAEVSIEDMKLTFPSLVTHRTLDWDKAWANEGMRTIVRRKLQIGWRLISKDADPESFGLDLESQRFLNDGFEMPSATTLIYMAVAHYRKTGERILPRRYVRSSDMEVSGQRAIVGGFNELGILVNFGGVKDDAFDKRIGFLPEVRRRV